MNIAVEPVPANIFEKSTVTSALAAYDGGAIASGVIVHANPFRNRKEPSPSAVDNVLPLVFYNSAFKTNTGTITFPNNSESSNTSTPEPKTMTSAINNIPAAASVCEFPLCQACVLPSI